MGDPLQNAWNDVDAERSGSLGESPRARPPRRNNDNTSESQLRGLENADTKLNCSSLPDII